jgi:hypothetical protein
LLPVHEASQTLECSISYSRLILMMTKLPRHFDPIARIMVLFLGSVVAVSGGLVSPELAISSITAQGTNLVFRATIPPGLEGVTLELRATMGQPWEPVSSVAVPPAGGEVVLSWGRPQFGHGFFRLRGTASSADPQKISSELQCVPLPSLASSSEEAVFHFQGLVDGSDRILITHEGALWEHLHWGWPAGAVSVNGHLWNPSDKNYLSSPVGKFLPDSFSLDSASLQITSGRDVVALERTRDGLLVCLDDTHCGASEYEFTVRFQPQRPSPKTGERIASARLKIAAQIDGSDCLKITAQEATWQHNTYEYPANISLNGIPWPLEQTMVLKNEGQNRFLPPGIDFSTARIIQRKGRDLATMWAEADSLWVRFADNPNGSDAYELEIAFGP